uniref:Uncharacterized protein B36 n=1 Tax=Nicotiana tabacum TaxID=4097 RepID=Q8H0H7_TOBAC|nr:hypothetical protein [Nicotiana tabacum]
MQTTKLHQPLTIRTPPKISKIQLQKVAETQHQTTPKNSSRRTIFDEEHSFVSTV